MDQQVVQQSLFTQGISIQSTQIKPSVHQIHSGSNRTKVTAIQASANQPSRQTNGPNINSFGSSMKNRTTTMSLNSYNAPQIRNVTTNMSLNSSNAYKQSSLMPAGPSSTRSSILTMSASNIPRHHFGQQRQNSSLLGAIFS